MNEQSRPSTGTAAGTGTASAAGIIATGSAETASKGATAAKAAVGPLTLRDLVVLGSVAIIFVASVVPIVKTIIGNANLWTTAGLFFIGIGVILPLIVGGLFLARRMSPANKVRIGSLSVDQFASVVASFATFFFFSATVSNFTIAYLIGLIGSLLLLVSTVCAQWIPALAADFSGRPDVPAHLAARDAVAALKRPAAPKPVVNQSAAGQQGASQQFGQQQFGQGAPSQGGPAQYVPGQRGAGAQQGAQQGGWNAAPAATHTSAGQIFTPAKENSAGAVGAGAAAAAGAVAAANPAASAAATSDPASANAAANTATQPSAGKPAAAQGESGQSQDAGATTLNPQVPESAKSETAKPEATAESSAAPAAARESITATVNPVAKPVVAEPFWFAVDRPQNVIDEKTRQFAFKLAPGAWILALEDRGSSFLVQDSHGKTGLLLDLVGIERASDSQ